MKKSFSFFVLALCFVSASAQVKIANESLISTKYLSRLGVDYKGFFAFVEGNNLFKENTNWSLGLSYLGTIEKTGTIYRGIYKYSLTNEDNYFMGVVFQKIGDFPITPSVSYDTKNVCQIGAMFRYKLNKYILISPWLQHNLKTNEPNVIMKIDIKF